MCSRMMIRVGAFDLMSEKKRSREKVPFFFSEFYFAVSFLQAPFKWILEVIVCCRFGN